MYDTRSATQLLNRLLCLFRERDTSSVRPSPCYSLIYYYRLSYSLLLLTITLFISSSPHPYRPLFDVKFIPPTPLRLWMILHSHFRGLSITDLSWSLGVFLAYVTIKGSPWIRINSWINSSEFPDQKYRVKTEHLGRIKHKYNQLPIWKETSHKVLLMDSSQTVRNLFTS